MTKRQGRNEESRFVKPVHALRALRLSLRWPTVAALATIALVAIIVSVHVMARVS